LFANNQIYKPFCDSRAQGTSGINEQPAQTPRCGAPRSAGPMQLQRLHRLKANPEHSLFNIGHNCMQPKITYYGQGKKTLCDTNAQRQFSNSGYCKSLYAWNRWKFAGNFFSNWCHIGINGWVLWSCDHVLSDMIFWRCDGLLAWK